MNDQPAQTTPFQPQTSQPYQDADDTASYVDAYNPPTPSASQDSDSVTAPQMTPPPTLQSAPPAMPQAPAENAASGSDESELLEDQNIFDLLGVKDGTDEQREQFLDELQQVIWEDFLENDARLLLTEDEMAQLKAILDKSTENSLEQQEEVVVFLEKLIPDLEDIMLEKALDLKADLFKERIIGTREYVAADAAKIAVVDQAEEHMQQNKWRSASNSLDTIKI